MANVTKPSKASDEASSELVAARRSPLPVIVQNRQVLLVALDYIESKAIPGESFSVSPDDAEIYVQLGRAVHAVDHPQEQLLPFPDTTGSEEVPTP